MPNDGGNHDKNAAFDGCANRSRGTQRSKNIHSKSVNRIPTNNSRSETNANSDKFLVNNDDDNSKKRKSTWIQRKIRLVELQKIIHDRDRRKIAICFSIIFLLTGFAFLIFGGGGQPEIPLSQLPAIDFVVGGFPKCGTTTLLYALNRHNEIRIPARESCALKDSWRPTYRVRQRYQNEIKDLMAVKSTATETYIHTSNQTSMSTPKTKWVTGIKCPTGIFSANFRSRLNEINQQHILSGNQNRSHNIKWIIGMRHPIWQVQSFYNYRITELYDKKVWWKDIRPLESIMSSKEPWKDMSSVSHQYQNHLADLLRFLRNTTSVVQSDASSQQQASKVIFLYTLEQIEDTNQHRTEQFRQDLTFFLGLETMLPKFGKENVNRFVSGPKRHPEIISICDERFESVRRQLIRDSTFTADWIKTIITSQEKSRSIIQESNIPNNKEKKYFHSEEDATILLAEAASSYVAISNVTFFNSILDTWKKDPCRHGR